jgi:dUTPase
MTDAEKIAFINLKGMSEQIDKSTQEWLKEIGAESPDAELKNRIAELSETARGAGGYGSTGK